MTMVEQLDATRGYRGPAICRVVGVSYKQLDYWATTGLVEPSVQPAEGSGSQRLYSTKDVVLLMVIRRLLDVGVSLQRIRYAIGYIRDRPLRNLTLASDGETIYDARHAGSVADLLAHGYGVFAIDVGQVYADVEALVAWLPSEPAAA